MKTRIMIPALFALGLATIPLMANPTESKAFAVETQVTAEDEKVQINPENLPELVKEAISKNETLKALKISEAWKITPENEAPHYVVKFENNGGELSKKFTSLGEEIED